MASPFSYFRKNQRAWMAATVLLAVLAFVVTPMLQFFSGQGPAAGRRSSGSFNASWDGGSITQDQIDIELNQLALANTFLKKLAFEVREKGGFPKVPEVRPDFSLVGITPDTRDPSSILERKVLAAEAHRLGIHFDEQSVTTFLQKFVDGKLSGQEIQKALREVSGNRMSFTDFNRLMREELAKNAVLRLANGGQRYEERLNAQGLPTAVLNPPSKNWQYFSRFKRLASVEAFPVFVNEFEDKVQTKPSDRELRDLFDKGKSVTRIDEPVVTEPAFMTPQMAEFEYLALDIDKVIEEEAAKIPEEELRAEYDRRVADNKYRVPLTEEEKKALEPANPASNLPPTLENPGDALNPESNNPQSGIQPIKQRASTQLVSFQDPTPQDPTPEPAVGLTVQDPKPDSTPTVETPTTDPQAPPAVQQPATRIQTFEEVKDGIAREKAAGTAFKILEQRVGQIRGIMEEYSQYRRAWERAVAEKDKSVKEPEKVNLQEVADKFGFQYSRTGLVNIRTLSSLPIGRSRVSRGPRMQPFEFPNLVRFAPTPNEPDNLGNLYVPSQSMALLTRFIFWKVEHREASTPSYESAKESVLSVWKTQKAAELAEAKAKEIAAKVGTSPLVEVLDEQTQRSLVVSPSPFSWFNPLVANFDIQLSNVEGLRPIGPDFMEKVFSTPAGSTVVVPDASREIYYVVKVARFLPGDDDLMVQFSQAPTTTGIQNISNLESSNSIRSWFAAIQKQLGFQSR